MRVVTKEMFNGRVEKAFHNKIAYLLYREKGTDE